ncbi:hypothetical protein HELRODRAFT_177039 [Helobdella robusta]|uniref:Uncharacterized protein n=1 Tax=Helobdella robusta TaxID=6412 RepID=T1FB61_HELRO|nr:hypothetical protein HELRODRAFT_177039 [Helobdella robusta]ESN98560.1 hypothetical protein HELRODRAFT_177039 [Helobdella robusta]
MSASNEANSGARPKRRSSQNSIRTDEFSDMTYRQFYPSNRNRRRNRVNLNQRLNATNQSAFMDWEELPMDDDDESNGYTRFAMLSLDPLTGEPDNSIPQTPGFYYCYIDDVLADGKYQIITLKKTKKFLFSPPPLSAAARGIMKRKSSSSGKCADNFYDTPTTTMAPIKINETATMTSSSAFKTNQNEIKAALSASSSCSSLSSLSSLSSDELDDKDFESLPTPASLTLSSLKFERGEPSNDKKDDTSDKKEDTNGINDGTNDKKDDTSDKNEDTNDKKNNTSDKNEDTNDKKDEGTNDKNDDLKDSGDIYGDNDHINIDSNNNDDDSKDISNNYINDRNGDVMGDNNNDNIKNSNNFNDIKGRNNDKKNGIKDNNDTNDENDITGCDINSNYDPINNDLKGDNHNLRLIDNNIGHGCFMM